MTGVQTCALPISSYVSTILTIHRKIYSGMFGNGNLGNKSKTWSYFRYNHIPDMSPPLLACSRTKDSFSLPLCFFSYPSITGVIKTALTNGIVLNGHPRPPPSTTTTTLMKHICLSDSTPPGKRTFSQLTSCVTVAHSLLCGIELSQGRTG